MHPPRRFRFTIGGWMALTAAFAAVLAVPHLQTQTELKVAACILASLPLLVLGHYLVEALFGIPCPGCAHWSLRRLVSCHSYYSCSRCGGRYKRSWLGPWLDASGPDDAAKFRGKARARTWTGFAVPDDPGGTTCGELLRNKRRRGHPGEKTR